MPLDPELKLTGNQRLVKVSASDVAGSCACGRFLALKTRPGVKGVDGWQRLFPPWGEGVPKPVVDIVTIVREAHGQDFATYQAQSAWLAEALDRQNIHRLLRSYVTLAVENVLEAHESIEAEIGQLRLLPGDAWIGTATRQLTAWGPVYETVDRIREIRRFRLGPVRADEDSMSWARVAAHVAAGYGAAPERVRVVEIGAGDGGFEVLFDGTIDEARAAFNASGRGMAAAAADEDHVVPCRSCGDCKGAGTCRGLISVDGMLGQSGRGYSSRSLSPGDLERYATCPAQWLLDSCLHLPPDATVGDGAVRGLAVHRWLRAAHARGIRCTNADMPDPGTGLGIADGLLTEAEYEVAYPFLAQHAGQCPLGANTALVLADENVYGYDHDAEVVPAIRPDLVYRDGDRLVIREFKTADRPYESGRAEAFERHLQVPFAVAMLNAGLLSHHGAASGTVELELITRSESLVWTWDAGDPAVAGVADGRVARAVEDWHEDHTWATRPGPYCAGCPVRRWCPDSEVWQAGATARAVLAPPAPAEDENAS